MTYVPQTGSKIYFIINYHEIGLNYKSNFSLLVISNNWLGVTNFMVMQLSRDSNE